MRKALILTGTAIAMTLAGPAVAAEVGECEARLGELNEKFSSRDADYRAVAAGPLARDIRELKDAARILARNGQQEACKDVVASIEEMVETRREERVGSDRDPVDPDAWFESEVTRLKASQPVDKLDRPLRAAEIIGSDVRNMKNRNLGEVDDVVLSPTSGEIQYAILSHGGFLGMGEKQIAVPWRELKVTTEGDDRVFVLNMSEEALEQAPDFDRGAWSEVDGEDWRRKNERYYRDNRM